MPDRPADSPDLNPARVAADPLLREIAALVGSMDLYIGRYEIKQLTTRQKEMWADLVDSDSVLDALDEPFSDTPRRTVRWWREQPVRPVNEEGHAHGEQAICRGCGKVVTWDADIEKFLIPYVGNPDRETFHCVRGPLGEPHWALPSGAEEPDPFRYADNPGSPGTRHPEPAFFDEPNPGALAVARHAVMSALQPDHPERPWVAEDLVAVYEWAKRSVVPLRRTDGEIGTLHAYPSPVQAAAFLDDYRAARQARWEQGVT